MFELTVCERNSQPEQLQPHITTKGATDMPVNRARKMGTRADVAFPAGGDNTFKAKKAVVSKKVHSRVLSYQKQLS